MKPRLDNKLLGEWSVQLSCDGSVLCYVCHKISFKADGFATIVNGVGEIERNRLKISNINNDNFIGDGEYVMIYSTDKDMTELKLKEITNSGCYELRQTTSN